MGSSVIGTVAVPPWPSLIATLQTMLAIFTGYTDVEVAVTLTCPDAGAALTAPPGIVAAPVGENSADGQVDDDVMASVSFAS